MLLSLLFSFLALTALVPAAVLPFRAREGGLRQRWMWLGLAAAGPTLWSIVLLAEHWRADFSVALWLSISASLVCFLVVCLINQLATCLAPLLLPYLFGLGVAATVFQTTEGRTMVASLPPAWVIVHVACSVATYGLVTLAAVAGLSVFLSEHALKRKTVNTMTARLPAVMDAERLQVGLLIAAIIVLLVGLLSGMGLQIQETRQMLVADHKTILSIAAFVTIAGLLVAHRRFGMRGRVAARIVLLAYLLLTLAYPGVKFVHDVLQTPG
jgi:ABC-type uncharacterized transport system permease subunit